VNLRRRLALSFP